MNGFDTGQFLNAFAVGQQQGQQRQDRRLQQEIGGLAAQGDLRGAGNRAYGAGQLQLGNAFSTMAQGREDQAALAARENEKAQLLALADGIMQNPDIYPALIADLENPQLGTGAIQVPPALRNDPRAGAAYLYRMAGEQMPEPTKGVVVGSDSRLVNPVTGQMMVEAAPKDPRYETVTTAEGIFEYIPGQPDSMRKIGNAPIRTPQTVVNVAGGKAESEFGKQLGAGAGNRYNAVIEAGDKATTTLNNVDVMETLLDEVDYTGFGGNSLLGAQRMARALGFDTEGLGAKEAMQRVSYELALALKENLPGPMSDADREFLLSIPPNLSLTREGNEAMLFIMRKRAQFERDMARDLMIANPQTFQEAQEWERNYKLNRPPLFDDATRSDLRRALGVR